MRFDLRSAVRAATDVRVPDVSMAALQARAAARAHRDMLRFRRSMQGIALCIAVAATVAAGSGGFAPTQIAMHTSSPQPEPIPT